MVVTSDVDVGFKDADYLILVGAYARRDVKLKRSQLIGINSKIFKDQGEAINRVAKPTAKVFFV